MKKENAEFNLKKNGEIIFTGSLEEAFYTMKAEWDDLFYFGSPDTLGTEIQDTQAVYTDYNGTMYVWEIVPATDLAVA